MDKRKELNTGLVQGHLAMFLANLGWGVMSPISKAVLMSGSISSLALSGIRITGGALLFFIFSFILPASVETRQPIERRDWWRLLLCSLLIISANQGLFIMGIGLTNPVDSAVMSSMTPIMTLILSVIFLRFPMTWQKVLGVLIGMAGVVMLVMGTPKSAVATNPLLGNMLCLGAQMCAAIYYVAFSGVISKYSPYTLMKWLFFISVFTYVPFCLPEMAKVDYAHLGWYIWLELAYIITVATFIGYLLMPFSQKRLKPTAVSMYNYLQPVFAAITAYLLGISGFGWVKATATLIIFLGIYLVNQGGSRTHRRED